MMANVRGFTERLGGGGEGEVFQGDHRDGKVCKVLYERCRTLDTIDKLKLMIKKRVKHRAVCWPTNLAISGKKKKVIGYWMRRASGVPLGQSIFVQHVFEKKYFGWTRMHLIHLTRSILEAIQHLHSNDVLLGDISAQNIMFESRLRVYLVDCDSYQIGRFPCRVGTTPYLHPELYGKDLESNLRTIEHELFAIATLVFMIFHPGKPPYSHRNGSDPVANVQKQFFPYPLDKHCKEGYPVKRPRQGKVPVGPWLRCWSHLPHSMKKAFHDAFCREIGRYPDVGRWLELLNQYEHLIMTGNQVAEIFPEEFNERPTQHTRQDRADKLRKEWWKYYKGGTRA